MQAAKAQGLVWLPPGLLPVPNAASARAMRSARSARSAPPVGGLGPQGGGRHGRALAGHAPPRPGAANPLRRLPALFAHI